MSVRVFKMEKWIYLEIIRRIMETCWTLTESQISRGCYGSSKSDKCVDTCSVYSNREWQCLDKLSIHNCDTCSLADYESGELAFKDVCRYAKEKEILGESKSE